MDKKLLKNKLLTSVGGRWEIVGTALDVELFYMRDKHRMMRNSIVCTYDELQQLLDMLKPLNEPTNK